jgi:hypothetical protein
VAAAGEATRDATSRLAITAASPNADWGRRIKGTVAHAGEMGTPRWCLNAPRR